VRTDLFHYDLPADLIAQQPPPQRRDARLLTLDGTTGTIADRQIQEIIDLTAAGDLLVFNNTRVLAARLFGTKQTGGRIEVLIERIVDGGSVLAHINASKAPKVGSLLDIGGEYSFRVTGRAGNLFRLSNESESEVSDIMQRIGHIPLPPYITRADTAVDVDRYQTVYGHVPGAVAAPTAGLHFDMELMEQLVASGVEIGFVTLHVGAGTFQPVRADNVEEHRMHSEYFEVSEKLCQQVERAQAAHKRVIAIGTTSVRALESAYADGSLRAGQGDTEIYIYPGFRLHVVDAMLTNFHLPESTLLMLVAAFVGRENILQAYRHAIVKRYRFFSYGDAMWITRGNSN
jgi:S-adenosylmethionine:tRNA ribosyltransferase-isomerase